MFVLLVTYTAQCGHDVASNMEAQIFSTHKTCHRKAQFYTFFQVFKELQSSGKAAFPTLFYSVFRPESTLQLQSASRHPSSP